MSLSLRLRCWWWNICYRHKIPKSISGYDGYAWCDQCNEDWRDRIANKRAALIKEVNEQ